MIFSNMLWGLASTDEHERMLERMADFSDMTPLSAEDETLLTSLVKRGSLEVRRSSKMAPKQGNSFEAGRRLPKNGKMESLGGGNGHPPANMMNGPVQTTSRNAPLPQETGRSNHYYDDYYYYYYHYPTEYE